MYKFSPVQYHLSSLIDLHISRSTYMHNQSPGELFFYQFSTLLTEPVNFATINCIMIALCTLISSSNNRASQKQWAVFAIASVRYHTTLMVSWTKLWQFPLWFTTTYFIFILPSLLCSLWSGLHYTGCPSAGNTSMCWAYYKRATFGG